MKLIDGVSTVNHEKPSPINAQRRRFRVRNRVKADSTRPRLSVFRSHKHIYAQIIDDDDGQDAGCGQHGATRTVADR